MLFYRRIVILSIVLALIIAPARAWDSGGHELVATLALKRINPKAKQAVDELAVELTRESGRHYDDVTLACWMDDLRKDTAMPHHGDFLSWHFIDIPLEARDPMPSFEPGNDNAKHGDIVQALKRATVVLRGGTDPYVTSKAMACAMVMHLVGDIHQPLHCATKYFISSHQLRQDFGGNKEDVINGPADDAHFNLHYFWDSAWRATFDEATGDVVLDERFHEQRAYGEPLLAPLADSIAKIMPPENLITEKSIDQWARESNAVARDFAYPGITATDNRKYCRLSSGYVSRANAIAKERLNLAAWRLAGLLNDTLGSDAPISPPASYPPGPASTGY